jgi:hypothetical protein
MKLNKGEKMKKLFLLLLTIATFAIGADVKPFVFENVAKEDSAQQAEFDYLLKYKMFGANGITFNGQNIKVPDKSGWFGTANGDFELKEIDHIIGGPILVGGNISFDNGQDGFTTGPVRATGDIIVKQTGFKDRANVSAGFNCVQGTVNEMFANIVANDSQFFGDNYTDCPPSVPEIKTTLRTPTFNDDTITYKEAIFKNGGIYTLDIADYCDLADTTNKLCDIYIEKITLNNDARLYVKMPVGGKLTRIFLKEGLILDGTHPQIRVMYGDNVIRNDKYSGNLLIYSTEDFVFEALAQTDSMQGTFITTGKIHIKQQMTLAGQLLANNLFIDANFDGSGFIYVKFDPDTLDIDPELNESAALRENDSTVVIPIKLSDTATIDVYFSYCFELNDKVDSSDFNLVTDFPVCGIDTKTVKIPVGSKVPTDSIKINVKKDDIVETSDSLIIKIKIESGAVLPNGETSGELKIKIKDAPIGHVEFDTTYTYKFAENDTGFVDTIKTLNKTATTRFYLDSAYKDSSLTYRYTLDSITGVLTLVGEPLDYEKDSIDVVKITLKDTGNVSITRYIPITVVDVNEPPTLDDVETDLPENLIHPFMVVKLVAEDVDTKPEFTQNIFTMLEGDTSLFRVDSDGEVWAKKTFDYETDQKTHTIKVLVQDKNDPTLKDSATVTISITNSNDGPKFDKHDTTFYVKENEPFKDTVKVIVTDGEFTDTSTVIIRVLDEEEIPEIKTWDDEKPKDTVKTNDPDHKFEWTLCEGDSCTTNKEFPHIKKDTTIKVCNAKKTKCDSIVVLFNDAPPVVTLTNAKSTNATIDYITIEEQKDDKIYVNKKDNEITVTVRDTVHKTEKRFNIDITLDTIKTKDIKLKEYNYLIDETLAQYTSIGGGLVEVKEVIKDNGTEITLTKIVDKNGNPVDTIQTVTYTKKVNGKDVVISYKTDNLTGQKIGDYEVSYMIDSCTKITYFVNDEKKIVTNKEGNIGYTVSYEYTDDFGNKATASVEIIYDDIPPKVEIQSPYEMQKFNTNAIPVKWTVNGVTQDTLTLQRLEKGINYVIRRYVDKAGNESTDTIVVIMAEAKDIEVSIVYPVTEINQDKIDSFYNAGNKYNPKQPYTITTLKGDEKPDPVGIGFKVDIALPSVNPTGGLADLSDIVKNGMIPVDDNGNIVGASTKGIPVEKYVEEHCTEEFQNDYRKHGLNIPLYDVKYNLHLWVWTTTANYVNDYSIEYTLNDQDVVSDAGTVQMVVDWLADKDGAVRAKNGHALGTGSYITRLYSKSIAKHRCDYKEQRKGDRTVKKEEDTTIFGFKRPIRK